MVFKEPKTCSFQPVFPALHNATSYDKTTLWLAFLTHYVD